MGDPNWKNYEIPLTPEPPRPPPRPAAKHPAPALAHPGVRLMAAGVDLVVTLSPFVVGWLVTQGGENLQSTLIRMRPWALGPLAIGVVQVLLLAARGQTIGKFAMGVRIVDYHDESNPGFLRAAVVRSLIPGFLAAIPCLGALFALFDLLCIFGAEHRCLHDYMADTKVVDV